MNAPTGNIEAQSLLGALAQALPLLEGAKKNSANPHFKSKYADLGAVIDAIRPIAEHGIWFRQVDLERDGGAAVETFYIGYGQEVSAGVTFVPADRSNAQGYGSAKTYARRYGLQNAFGLSSEDDDGNAAAAAPPPKDWREPDSIYTGKSKLHKGLTEHDAEIRRMGKESTLSDLEGYLASPEFKEFVRISEKHAQHYLYGGRPAPEEFVGINDLIEMTKDQIALRGNTSTEPEA